MIAAIVLVLGVVVLVVVLSSRGGGSEGDKQQQSRTPPAPPTRVETDTPSRPPAAAYPTLAPHLGQKAKRLADEAKELAKDGERLYNEAGKAKQAGDDDLWQAKLNEASTYYDAINDLWNELITEVYEVVGDDGPYDAEEVVNHYFGNEAETVRRAAKRRADIQKDRRGS